jgi:serine/threonine protein kinase
MTDAFVEEFLESFNDSHYPADFQQDYELMECLAHNEIGETLLVKDRQTGELCVSKCYADQTLLSSTSESSLLKDIHRDGLPSFIGEYQNKEMLCVVRSYAEGTPLDQLVRQQPLTERQAIHIALQLCDILTFLHNQNPPVIHRDIKPGNIVVDEQGRVTLIDFGISRAYDENSREDTHCFGTRYFAAPEQYGFSQTDPRTDIFSLGILLYWMLTGRLDLEKARKSISNRRLLSVINKCTAFDPKDRFKSAVQVKDALTGRKERRNWLAAIAATLVVLTGILHYTISGGVKFKEPLIEEAVRLSLGKSADETLSEEDLLAIEEIFVLGDQAAPDRVAFDGLVDEFASGSDSIGRGDIDSLDDLVKLKNIRHISIAYQSINDIAPVAQLTRLETLDLRNNSLLEDLSPLSQSTSLSTLVLFDANVSDFSMLGDCPHLSLLDAGRTPLTSLAALDGLDALQTLVVRDASLQSLEGIADHPMLETIYLSGNPLNDLSPLLDLPRLRTVEISEEMRPLAEAIKDQAHFEIIY